MENPLVTVNILSFNRKDELRYTLTKVYEQDYKNIEVIVVDNASSDGSPEMVAKEFPQVKLIRLAKNIGIAGWNKGFEAAKGDYVLVLDDDSYPENGAINSGVNILSTNEQVAVIGFLIFNLNYSLIENSFEYRQSKGKLIEANGFIGCGAMINKKIFLELRGYEGNIFLYYNELDFSIRAINKNYKILFNPYFKVFHTYSLNFRKASKQTLLIDKRRFEQTFRSYFIFLFLHFDTKYLIRYGLKLILSKLYVAIKLNYFSSYIKKFFSLFPLSLSLIAKREPVTKSVQEKFNYGNIKFRDLYVFYD